MQLHMQLCKQEKGVDDDDDDEKSPVPSNHSRSEIGRQKQLEFPQKRADMLCIRPTLPPQIHPTYIYTGNAPAVIRRILS